MKSPIARALARASRWAEKKHRQMHGPKFAPGDVVDVRPFGKETPFKATLKSRHPSSRIWLLDVSGREPWANESQIRVVRYAGGQ